MDENTISDKSSQASDDPIDLTSTNTEYPIPEGAVDLTSEKDGGAYKIVKREGTGEAHPSTGDTVTVHYVGTLVNGTKFDSSRDRGEPFNFNLGRSQVIKGWDIAVATMKKGELCEIILKANYAYGAAGSPPRIPPNATLIFEIELISWEGEDISPDHDKSITRSVQKEGEKYEYPNDGAAVTAHVIGIYEGRQFINGEVEFTIGEATEVGLPEGVDRAIKKFRKGEHSLIHLQPRWGYGRQGNDKYNIPPNAELDFEIQLKHFEKAKDTWQMDTDEKLEEAEKLKQRGAEFFQQGKNKLAAIKYKRMIDLLEHEKITEQEKKEKRDILYRAAHNNLAMIYLKADETTEAIKHCDKVLVEEPKNVKALYRRAQAYQNQNDFDDAIKNYEMVLAVEPENKAAQANIAKCRNGIAEQRKKEKAVFGNMFGKQHTSPKEISKDAS